MTVTLLTVGLTLIAASGAAYEYLFAHNNYPPSTTPWALGWSAGVVIVGIAALTCPPEPPYAPPEPPASLSAPQWLWLPYLPLAIAGGLELADFRSTVLIPTPRSSWCRGWLSPCWPANSWWSPKTGGWRTACPIGHYATR